MSTQRPSRVSSCVRGPLQLSAQGGVESVTKEEE